ncbi:MAG: divalent-cation tolerance protein CutA [Planctomycetota bacterium]
MDYLKIVTTVDRHESALKIAEALVAEGAAACVQIVGPVTSVYRWQGAVEKAEEWQCWIKTRRDKYPHIEEIIRRLHSYEVPEILAVPVTAGHEPYLAWIDDSLR